MQRLQGNAPVHEAVDQWIYAVRRMAEPLPGFEEQPFPDGVAIWSNAGMSLLNEFLLERRLTDDAALDRVLDAAVGFAGLRAAPWVFTACDPYMPPGARQRLRRRGFEIDMPLTYMVAEALNPPPRPLPHLEFRRIDTPEAALLMADLNCMAYGIPLETGRSTVSGLDMFARESYGVIGYLGADPVSTATVLFAGDCLNVVSVATAPEQGRKGFAEATMRHALDRATRITGLRRTVLHSTRAGYALYQRMGYTPVVVINLWSLSDT